MLETIPGIIGDILLDPHPYQYDALRGRIEVDARGCKSGLVVMPTGTGKTLVQMLEARMAIEAGERVLYLVHTDELIRQASESTGVAGLKFSVEKADRHAFPQYTRGRGQPSLDEGFNPDPRLVVGSVATMRGKRLSCLPEGLFDLVIIDEAHHSAAASYRKIIGHLKPKRLTGYTATPDRSDGTPIVGKNQIFEELAFEYKLAEAVEKGYLKRPIYDLIECEIDLRALGRRGMRDYSDEDIDKALLPHVSEIVNELKPRLEGHHAIIFAPLIRSAQAIADAMQSVGMRAEWISGCDPDRAQKLVDHRSGKFDHLVNAMLLTEGYDAKFIDYCVVLRATKSRSLLVQMIGRALRSYPGKPTATIVAVNWKTLKAADLKHPTQIYDSPFEEPKDEEVEAEARRIMDSGEEDDILAALKQASKTVEEAKKKRIQEEERKKMVIEARKAKAKSYKFDPLAMGSDFQAPEQAHGSFEPLATAGQLITLEKFGIPVDETVGWSKAKASAAIGQLITRSNAGLASYKQGRILSQHGIDPTEVTKAAASKIIDRLFNKKPAEKPVPQISEFSPF